MANVKMEELPRVQTIGPGGRGVYPPVPTEEVSKVSSAGLEMKELQRNASVLPHPGAITDGSVLLDEGEYWGANGANLPDPSTAEDDTVLTVEDGKYKIADISVVTDVDDLVAPAYSPNDTYTEGQCVIHEGLMYKAKQDIDTPEEWTAAHWDETTAMHEIENKADVTAVEASMASEYTSKTYKAGEYCYHDGTLYRCKSDIDTAETWTAAHWEAAKLADDTSALKTIFTQEITGSLVSKTTAITFEQGGLSSGNGGNTTANNRIRTSSVLPVDIVGVTIPDGKKSWVYAYLNGVYQGRYCTNGTFSKNTASSVVAKDMIGSYLFAELHGLPEYTYRIVVGNQNDSNLTPSDASTIQYYYRTDETLSLSGKSADAKTTGDEINRVESKIDSVSGTCLIDTEVVFNQYADSIKYGLIIDGAKKWKSGEYESIMIPVPVASGTIKLHIVGNNSEETYIGFMTSDYVGKNSANVDTWATGYNYRTTISANTESTIDIPTDCKSIWVMTSVRGGNTAPSYIAFKGAFTPIYIEEAKTHFADKPEAYCMRVVASDSDGHDIPQSQGIYNLVKKVKQFVTVPWTALSSFAGNSSTISAGSKTGLPYSSVKEYDKFVGFNVSLKTFMTAAHNPYSLLYTEDVNISRSTSDYGIEYHGYNCGSYFGIVCNILALYGLGVDVAWNSQQFDYLYKQHFFEKSSVQSAYGLRLGDIILEPNHVNAVVDIVRNSKGEPTTIYWAESVTNFPAIREYTLEQAQSRLESNGGVIYYYPKLYENGYTPSEFVAVEGETIATPYEYNDDICTFAGDYACFNSTEDIYINYTAGTYTSMEVYKGDTLLSTITLEPSAHKVKITTDGYGLYKARLTDGTNNSDYTYFEIVDTTASTTYSNGIMTTTFSSANGEALYAEMSYRNGHSRGIIPISGGIKNGTISFDPVDVFRSQYNSEVIDANIYVKVYFKGQYGVVTNPYVGDGIQL